MASSYHNRNVDTWWAINTSSGLGCSTIHLYTLLDDKLMYILGISAFYHDSAACLLKNGEIIAAAQEERFTRKKHDSSFPLESLKYIIKNSHLKAEDVDYVAFYDKPFLKFERILETYLNYAPRGLKSFIQSMPIWIKEKLFLPQLLTKELNSAFGLDKKNAVDWKKKLLFP